MLQMDNAGGRREQAGWRSRLKRNGYKFEPILSPKYFNKNKRVKIDTSII